MQKTYQPLKESGDLHSFLKQQINKSVERKSMTPPRNEENTSAKNESIILRR
jgi:hypothetical protein